MTTIPFKLALATGTLSALSLLASSNLDAKPMAKDPFQNKPSVQSYSMTMQSRGRLGAKVMTISEDLRNYFGAPKEQGLLVDSVLSDSPAAKAGLRSGDVIIAVQDQAISETWDIMQAMNGAKKGDAVKVDIMRDKKKRTLSATLDSDGDMQMSWGPGQGGFQFDFGQGVNPFAPQGNGQGLFGQGFPFNHGSFGSDDMQERMQELEQRLQELEGRSSPLQTLPRKSKPGKAKQAPGASTPGASKDKPFRSAPGVGAGTSS